MKKYLLIIIILLLFSCTKEQIIDVSIGITIASIIQDEEPLQYNLKGKAFLGNEGYYNIKALDKDLELYVLVSKNYSKMILRMNQEKYFFCQDWQLQEIPDYIYYNKIVILEEKPFDIAINDVICSQDKILGRIFFYATTKETY